MIYRKNIFIEIIFSLLFLQFHWVFGQNLDVNSIVKSTDIKVSGGISASTVFYNSNQRSSRESFTYFMQGNLNVSWLTFSMPLTYSFTNQGGSLGYEVPFNFNRLSLHPTYKWIQGHIGDVAMTFSPYTVNGHQFTGVGVDLTPEGALNVSALSGRFLKAIEDDGNPQTLPIYKRMGYGTKLDWGKENYKIGVIGFYAKDDQASIVSLLDEGDITPKENLVASITSEVLFGEGITLNAEYSSTAVTQDTRATGKGINNGLVGLFFEGNTSTEYYSAIKTGLGFEIDKMQLGLAYERVDPGYETLGAYFFNNDFENITVNGSRPLFNGKLNVAFNTGYQRENLENQKKQTTSRFVGSMNATLQASDKITITGSYSDFSSYTNQSLNQFDDINDNDLTDEDLEALNYTQLSQNANMNMNWILTKGEKTNQTVNFMYALASSANEKNGVIRVGQANNFHNTSATYTIGIPDKELTVTSSANFTYADVARNGTTTYGGSLNLNKKLFENKLNSTLGAIYNTSDTTEGSTNVLTFTLNASTIIAQSHNFNLNAIQLFRKVPNQDNLSELTFTLGYTYSFDVGKPKNKTD